MLGPISYQLMGSSIQFNHLLSNEGKGEGNAMATDKLPAREPNIRRNAEQRKRDFSKRPQKSVQWSEVGNQLLRDTVCAIADSGAAIMFGRTSDGGAYSITVLDGDSKIREWPHTVDECETTLRWLVQMFSTD